MDHMEYENTMFEGVNRNCENAEQAREEARRAADKAKLEAYLAAEEERNAMRLCMKRHATAKIIIWFEVFVCALLSALYFNLHGLASPVLQVAICGVVGLVTGLRVNALARAFRK